MIADKIDGLKNAICKQVSPSGGRECFTKHAVSVRVIQMCQMLHRGLRLVHLGRVGQCLLKVAPDFHNTSLWRSLLLA